MIKTGDLVGAAKNISNYDLFGDAASAPENVRIPRFTLGEVLDKTTFDWGDAIYEVDFLGTLIPFWVLEEQIELLED